MTRSPWPNGRRILYGLYELLLLVWIAFTCARYDGLDLKRQFHDVNPIQYAQEAHLGVAALLYVTVVAVAYRKRSGSEFQIFLPILCCLLWGTNRELDGVWERHDLDRVYNAFKYVTSIPGIVFVSVYWRSCWEGLLEIRRSRGFHLLMMGIAGYVAAQIVGEGFESLGVSRNYERAAEESLELLFGAFFVFSGIETLLQTANRRIPQAR